MVGRSLHLITIKVKIGWHSYCYITILNKPPGTILVWLQVITRSAGTGLAYSHLITSLDNLSHLSHTFLYKLLQTFTPYGILLRVPSGTKIAVVSNVSVY